MNWRENISAVYVDFIKCTPGTKLSIDREVSAMSSVLMTFYSIIYSQILIKPGNKKITVGMEEPLVLQGVEVA